MRLFPSRLSSSGSLLGYEQNVVAEVQVLTIGKQYFKGVLAGYLGANFMSGPITEW